MNTPIDTYTFRARLQPGLLATLPLAIAVTAFYPEGVSWWTPLWGAIVTCGGTYLLAELARQAGKRREAALYASWNGKPTTQLLRHRATSNPLTLARYHERLHALRPDLVFPSLEQELAQPSSADDVYSAAVDYLREHTRRNKLVFQANCEYGFRRNAYGLRPYAIAIAFLALSANLAILASYCCFGSQISLPTQLAAAALNGCLGAVWLFVIRADWVRTTAFAYAERLLAAVETISPGGGAPC